MRPIVDWIVAVIVFTAVAFVSLRQTGANANEPPAATVSEAHEIAEWPSAIVPAAEPVPEPPLTLPDESWCEPMVPTPCNPDGPACPSAPDGTRSSCVQDWFGDSGGHVCVVGYPSAETRRWRAARLRVLVDEICEPRAGCDPAALHGYLSAIILRESTWRPYKAHRLSADLEANARAWAKYADRYRHSPAAGEPARWAAGRGYYGQNAAALLHVWDPTEIPEALCGEVEATLVHLRTARRRLRRLKNGVTCGGKLHHGTAKAGGPSWYDVSLTNSGSDPCPGVVGSRLDSRRGFERRARSQGVRPYGAVTLRMLGREVPRSEQAAFASRVRRKMDAVPR